MANDPTVKAGSWGARTVEKIVRLTELALRHELPVFWLVDSAGARITDQVAAVPGPARRRAHLLQPGASCRARCPQICCLFGPSAAGGAYIPSFCDIVIMVEGNASMYLGSPRMAEMVIGEIATLEEMGGARMHATVSGCGDNLAVDDEDAIDQARAYFTYFPPTLARATRRAYEAAPPAAAARPPTSCPVEERRAYDMHDVIDGLVDAESFFEIKPLFAPELIVGLRPARRPARRHRGQQPDAEGRRALRRLGRQGGPLHLVLRRLQHPAGVPGRRARLHDRHRRSSARASSATAPR